MPYVGQASFLQKITFVLSLVQAMCQCPMSGKPHFYRRRKQHEQALHPMCQCPMSGKPHFYAPQSHGIRRGRNCVNALCRASLISTIATHRSTTILVYCVNALCRASLISTDDGDEDEDYEDEVSMPYVGQASFLPTSKNYEEIYEIKCQCPMSGKPHFYASEATAPATAQEGVNALCRASLISTI